MPTESHYMRHFPFPTASNPASHCTQLPQWKNVKRRNPEFNSSEIFATLKNMFQALPRDELLHWEEKAALIRANPSVSPHNICAVASKNLTAKKGSARKKIVKEMRPKIISEKPDLTPLEVRKELGALWHALSNDQNDAYRK